MPAIQLARLKIQVARLAEKYAEPDAFLHDLNEILDSYTNRTFRASQESSRLSKPTYHTPPPVLRQIKKELAVLADQHSQASVVLVNALWKGDSLESQLLAAYLLGCLPSAQAIPTLIFLPEWLNQSTNKEIRTALLTDALARLRREEPSTFFRILEGWLGSPRPTLQVWGLRALIPLLQDSRFENLPAVFRILRPALLTAGPATQLDFQACLQSLERLSPTEMVAFLREVIQEDPRPMMLRILRRILPALSQESQAALRKIFSEQTARLPG
jgi:hypothetical protein